MILCGGEFLREYQAAAEKFDGDEDVVFFRGIENPDDWTEIAPRGVVFVRASDGSWDAIIRKVPNDGHQAALYELVKQLGYYADAMNAKFTPKIRAGGGHRKVDEVDLGDEDVLPEKRVDPDVLLRVAQDDDLGPRVVIEIEVSNRDPLELAKHVHQLMKSTSWHHVRCVVGLKIYKRSGHGEPFAVVCFVWKKRDDDSIFVERIFDIGPRPSGAMTCSKVAVAKFWTENKVDFTADDDGLTVTPLPHPLAYPLPEDCPDELGDHFTVNIPRDMVYHGHSPSRPPPEKKAKLDVDEDTPLKLDLFEMLRKVDRFKSQTFSS